MTDNEIIKALECCADENLRCGECCYKDLKFSECYDLVHKGAIDLINRQKSEIERLKAELKEDSRVMKQALVLVGEIKKEIAVSISTAKAEAVKEFAELIKRNHGALFNTIYSKRFGEIIDNLVKEMVGEG